MNYAPVVIPTLNRLEHLKKCIGSLQKNTLATDTELFISLDYPPDEKYVTGYMGIKAYLQAGIKGFADVHIFFQEKNLGPRGNSKFLLDQIRGKYDVYIFSEDDNEFAPCYLEYMNRCLEQFKEDDTVLSIYANRPRTIEKVTEAVFKVQDFSAYGSGIWIGKKDQANAVINRNYIEDVCCDRKVLKKLEKNNPALILACTSALLRKEKLYCLPDGSVPHIDMMYMIYNVVEDKYMVCSDKPLVKNNGFDGSGVNCEISGRKRMITRDLVTEEKLPFDIPKNLNTYRLDMKMSTMRGKLKQKILVTIAYIKIYIWRLIANRI